MTTTTRSLTFFGFRLRTLSLIAALLLIGVAALALDLLNKGLVYDYLWNKTGETEPEKQLLGFGQYLMSFTRRQPDTRPYAHVSYTDVNPFGVNTFLEQEVLPENRERQMQMIDDAGFHWICQQFPWYDIEINAKGDYRDYRHDYNGDGTIDEQDAISAWGKYDNIVDLAEQYGLEIITRLSAPPKWAQTEGMGDFAPPTDIQDYVDFATAVATRYQGRLHTYQVWNEPNLYPEWGNQTVNAEAYTDMLCRTYKALKAVDPENVVITGAIGPTIDLSGRNAYDLLYLQRMYQAGAGDCFDILSVQGYGLWSGPTDHRLRQTTINYQRQVWLRDMMVANGDEEKPIWISEMAWNPVPNDPGISDMTYYGQVTMEQAAEWAPLAYERAIEEWPWIGVINYWYFKPADDHDKDKSFYYFRMVEPDFTPTPVYTAMKDTITGRDEWGFTLGAGRHGAASHKIQVDNTTGLTTYHFRIKGTGVYVCAGAASIFGAEIDGKRVDLPSPAVGCFALPDDLDAGKHTLSILSSGNSVDSIIVIDDSARQRLPWILVGGIAAAFTLVVLVAAVNRRLRLDRMRRGLFLLLALIVLLLGAWTRFHHLDDQSLWNDEGNSLRLAQRDPGDLIDAAGRDIHPPGYYLALKLWIGLVGDSELSLRMLSALAGLLTVGAVIALGRALFGRSAALVAGLITALHPFAVYYSQEARMYAALGLFSVLSTWLFVRWIQAQDAAQQSVFRRRRFKTPGYEVSKKSTEGTFSPFSGLPGFSASPRF